jgi:hypothetical protein
MVSDTKSQRPVAGARPVDLPVLVVGSLALLVLGLFAWHYYLERTACFDSAFFSWLMIDAGEPISALGRYGSWIPQLLPVTLIEFGLPLEAVLRSYSVSFILFHGLVFYIIAFRLKDGPAALALPLTLTAAFHYMFYYGISELYQGLSLSVLLWAVLRRAWSVGASMWWSVGALLLNVVISVYHQLLVLPLVFLLVHVSLEDRRWRERKVWALGLALMLWYVVRIALMTKSSYEEARMPKMADLLTYAFQLKELNSTVYFLMVWTKFKALLLIMAVGGGLAVMNRSWARSIWAFAFSFGFIVLILIVDRDGMAPVLYENYYPVVGLVWCVFFATEAVAMKGRWKQLALGTAALASALGLLQIHRGHYRLTDRVDYSRRITSYQAAHGVRKSLVRFDNYPWTYGLVHWAVGFESALCSAVEGPQQAATIFVSDKVALLDTVAGRPDQFLGPDWQPIWFGLQNLDQRYFDFPKDVGYTWANTVDTIPKQVAITLEGPATPYRMVPDRFTVVPLRIRNTGIRPMPSCGPGGRPVQFTYQLLRTDGTLYQESAFRSSLEVDVLPGSDYMQGLVVERPVDNGNYTVRAWLEYDGSKVGPEVRFDVVADGWPL